MNYKLLQAVKVVFWIAVAVAGIWLIDRELTLYGQRKEKILNGHLERICSVITDEQPNNINLYDNCMNAGYEELSPPEND